MKNFITILFLILRTQAAKSEIFGRPFDKFKFSLELETVIPLYVGGSLGINRGSHQIAVGAGWMPSLYGQILGKEMDVFYNHKNHTDLFNDIYKENHTIFLQYTYKHNENSSFGISYLVSQFKGETNFSTLEVLNNHDYSTYQQTLATYETSDSLNVDGVTNSVAVKILTKVNKQSLLSLFIQYGLVKNISNEVKITSKNKSYSSSAEGQTQLNRVKEDFNTFFLDPGVIPFFGLSIRY